MRSRGTTQFVFLINLEEKSQSLRLSQSLYSVDDFYLLSLVYSVLFFTILIKNNHH